MSANQKQGERQERANVVSTLSEERSTKSNAIEIPQITLPKGGGALKGIDEKFLVNAANGTASFAIPLPVSPNRNGFTPQLSLSYNSGVGNGPFGIGWELDFPSIQRRTDKKLPRYFDSNDIEKIATEDSFMFSGAEELVPMLELDGGQWKVKQFSDDTTNFIIRQYRPRLEGSFLRIERIFEKETTTYYWKVTTKENITTFFGLSASCRIADPTDESKVFQWLPEFAYDDKGSWVWYEYKEEDLTNVANEVNEKNRFEGIAKFTNRHLKRVKYGNSVAKYVEDSPYQPALPVGESYFFELVFDYGEHAETLPKTEELEKWSARNDAFSSYRSGFELRTYRLCKRVLMFHHFSELGNEPTLVRSLDMDYKKSRIYGGIEQKEAEVTYLRAIEQCGYVKNGAASYSKRTLPKLTFEYQELNWNKDVKNVSNESLIHSPSGLSGNYQWVDLYNEGINGLLTEQANAWFYKSNFGVVETDELHFSQAQMVMPKPSFLGLGNGSLQLQDLNANGEKQLVVNSGGVQGYFELKDDGEWQPFRTFLKNLHLDLKNPNVRMLDVNGDGKPEVVLSDEGAFWFWENEGKIGYDAPELAAKPYDEEQGAAIVFADQEQRIFLADMSGDGMTDIVRIRNGEVCYWANMGYGRFAPKVTMRNSPVFDHSDLFNPSYIQLADVSGTGATDIIYLGKNTFKAYLNCSGNAWTDGETIEPFFSTEQPNRITITDLLGNGTACIVWSSEMPAYVNAPMRYMDLMGGNKPHLMKSHENGLGKTTSVAYKSSTFFYLKDKLNGTPWITKLAFPVQVVAKTISTDSVTNVRFSAEYSYHHGYYDHAEREFRGFGRVEQRDTEEFEVTDFANLSTSEHHQPPVLTKTWFHTGAFLDRDRILNQFKQEYWYKNEALADVSEYELPDAVLLAADHLGAFDINIISADEWREALRACKGMTLRQEVFGLDAKKRIADERKAKNYVDGNADFEAFKKEVALKELIPYNVATHNCEIQLLQARGKNRYASFIVKESEAITFTYERDHEDPRIAHTLNLETDELGNLLESVSIVYPRKKEEPLLENEPSDNDAARRAKQHGKDGQKKTWITFAKNDFTNDILAPANYYLRKNWQTQTYELTGVKPQSGYFKIADFKNKVTNFQEIEYQQIASGSLPQKRLIEHIKTKFYDADLSLPLADGQIATRAVPYEAYQLAFTPHLINNIFTPSTSSAQFEVTETDLLAAKYLSLDAKWWVQSGTVIHKHNGENFDDLKGRFFASVGYIDPFDSETAVEYDARHLFMQRALAYIDKTANIFNETKVLRFNYRTLSPDVMQDINDNISSVIVDELGLVKATAIEGKDTNNDQQGEEADNLNGFKEHTDQAEKELIAAFFATAKVALPNVCAYNQLQTLAWQLLGSASARMVYDFSAQPTVVASIVREQHANVNLQSPLQISFEYTDGMGKVAMKKVQAEPGIVKLPNGTEINTENKLRWIGNGRTVLNNKGNPIKQYEPYFSTTPAYEADPMLVEQGVSPILYYDGAGRNVRTELPNGTFTKVVFDAWKQLTYDVNDTIEESTWKNDLKNATAYAKSKSHADTPSCIILDSLGRPTLGIDHNKWLDSNGNPKEEKYFTYSTIDIEGNALSVTDARGNTVMAWRYDMLGHRVMQTSMDAGKRWMLNDASGKPIRAFDERGHEFIFEYDKAHRPTKKIVRGGDGAVALNHCYETIIYGEGLPNDKAKNLRGQAAVLYDTAGKITSERHDFKGNLLESTRVFAKDYKNTPHWDTPNPDDFLEGTKYTFTTNTTYDALNRPVQQITPDGKATLSTFNTGALLEKVILREGSRSTEYVSNIDYNEKGQRTRIIYGNGVTTKYDYDSLTFRLQRLFTSSLSGSREEVLQDLNYTYDPTGNITTIQDRAIPTVFFNNQKIQGKNEYTYDALYRLVTATGREQNTNSPNFDTCDNWNDAFALFNHNSGDTMAMRNYTQRYQYDQVGNILQMKHEAGANGSWTRNNAYESKNNRIKNTTVGNSTYNFTHHALHGYMEVMPHLSSMVWTFKEELQATAKQVVNNGTPETTYYVYDSSGQRARKITENQAAAGVMPTFKDERIYVGGYEIYKNQNGLERETLHIMDDKQRIAMIDTETEARTFLGMNLGRTSPEQTVRYQLGNHLGSASLELDENAAVISYEEYHPYGTTAYQARNAVIKAAAKRYRYTGMERDEETGLEYHSARYYMAWLGRWISGDPLELKDGINVFVYVKSNPLNLYDPSGTLSWGQVAGIAAAVVVGTVVTVATAGAAGPVVGVALATVIGGAVGGAAGGAVGEVVEAHIDNREAHVGRAALIGAVAGGVFAGAGVAAGAVARSAGGQAVASAVGRSAVGRTATTAVSRVSAAAGRVAATEAGQAARSVATRVANSSVGRVTASAARRATTGLEAIERVSERAGSSLARRIPGSALNRAEASATTECLQQMTGALNTTEQVVASPSRLSERALKGRADELAEQLSEQGLKRSFGTVGVLQGEVDGQVITLVGGTNQRFTDALRPLLREGEEIVEPLFFNRIKDGTERVLRSERLGIWVHTEQVLANEASERALVNSWVATSNNACKGLCRSSFGPLGDLFPEVLHINPGH
ncbi:RHS repeat-associated protein [Runella defluvii]|uniref:RHS repeat-associated protein n=1 Tax=Runella defluvii TaxID=370973 RepID=A0A7W5ZQV8_9BACT|nr:SpvB/TcaC N-terminal domain-containing protein [Runella defluvii]MBB3841983.1 RHS repeat-associated protein [Runella defluvii]